MSAAHQLQVGDVVRERGTEELLRVTDLYEGCDEVVVEYVDEPGGGWDVRWFDLDLVDKAAT